FRVQESRNKYRNKILSGPSVICSCCGGLFNHESITPYSEERLVNLQVPHDIIAACPKRDVANFVNLCSTCKKYVVTQKTLPKVCLAKYPFPDVPEELLRLTPLEERMISTRIPFMNIRPLGYGQTGQQWGIRG